MHTELGEGLIGGDEMATEPFAGDQMDTEGSGLTAAQLGEVTPSNGHTLASEDDKSDYDFSDLNEELFRDAEAPVKSKKFQFSFEERAREDLEFPDEVDTPTDIPASQRYFYFVIPK